MKRFVSIAACLAAMTTAPAWSQAAAPLVFDAEGRPSAQVRVNDEADFLFAIDTAAQRTGIGAPIIDALDLQPDPDQVGRMHGVAGVVEVDMYTIDLLQLGDRRVEDSLVVSLTGGHDLGGHAHQGILGQDVFASRRLELDFAAMSVRLDAVEDAEEQAVMPARFMYGGFALVDIDVGGVATIAVIDTGAARSFGNQALLNALARPDEEIEVREEVRGVSQDAIEVFSGVTRSVSLGSVELDAQSLEFIISPSFDTFRINDRPAIVLGMDVLSRVPGIALDYADAEFAILAP